MGQSQAVLRSEQIEEQPSVHLAEHGARRQVGRIAKPFIALVILLVAWQMVAVYANVAPSYVLPTPTSVAVYIPANFGKLMGAESATIQEMLLGFAIALVAGILLAIVVTQVKPVGEAILPLIVITQVIPSIAIAPMLVLLFGFGLLPKVLVAAIVAFFPIVINTTSGLRSLDADTMNLSKSLRSSRYQHLRYLALPTALPYIFAGARIGVTLSLIGAVVGEFVTSNAGLGYLVLQGESTFSAQQVFAALVFLAITGILAFSLVQLLARIFIPWATHAEAER